MKNVNHFRYFSVLVIAVSLLTACQKEKPGGNLTNTEIPAISENINVPESNSSDGSRSLQRGNPIFTTHYGPSVAMGNGYVRSWVNILRYSHKPIALGIEFTGNSFENLPTDPTNFPMNTFVLPLPQKAKEVTPFDHITINWEVEGHEPPGIYDIPHFDIHFYKISMSEQMAISGAPTSFPPVGYLPASYVIEGATVPQMGTHWLDPAFPELPPTSSLFTHTFIYGSNGGEVIFLEPMITRAFLLSGTWVSKAIAQPTNFSPRNTYYPAVYNIWNNPFNGRHYVALTNFAWR